MTITPRANRPLLFSFAPIAKLKASDDGARTHNLKQQKKLVTSLRKFGQVEPLVIDDHGCIIDGDARLDAMKRAGYDEIAVMTVVGLSAAEKKALRLALNRIPQDAGWDNQKLRDVLSGLIDAKVDLDLTGFDAVEIDHLVEIDHGGDVIEDADDIPAPAEKAVSRSGDVWVCGDHRIGCGDALDLSGVERILGGARPAMSFLDPPYNVPIDGFATGNGKTRHREFVTGSGEMAEAEFVTFLATALQVVQLVVGDGLIFACMDWRHLYELLTAAR